MATTKETKEAVITKENIYSKMLHITAELERVGKNLEVGKGTKAAYKAASEKDVIEAIKPLEAKYKVYSFPYSRKILKEERLETTNQQGYKRVEVFMRLETTYRFVNVDEPSEYIDVITYGDGIDTADKAPGKAMTYADKYALMKAYKVSTGDDPDKDLSEPHSSVTPAPQLNQAPVKEMQSNAPRTLEANGLPKSQLLMDFDSYQTLAKIFQANEKWFVNECNKHNWNYKAVKSFTQEQANALIQNYYTFRDQASEFNKL